MNKSSSIYVAGHKGLVGSSLVRKLQSNGYCNILTKSHSELDLTRQADVEEFFESNRPEYVFLAAAKVGGILANNIYKADFIYNNIVISSNIINASYKYGVKKLLNLGSSCIYPKFAPQPMKEEYLLSGPLEPTNEPYAIAKISAIKLCRYFNEQYDSNFISVMPTNLYGPNDNFNLETAHVLPALIRKFHLAKLLRGNKYNEIKKDLNAFPAGFALEDEIDVADHRSIDNAFEKTGITGDHIKLWGAGEIFREFLFVDDLADACLFFMEKYNCKDIGEFINVGTGEDIKIIELANTLKDIVGFEGGIMLDTSKPEGTPKKLLDISKSGSLGWRPLTGLKEGLERTYNWYTNAVAVDHKH